MRSSTNHVHFFTSVCLFAGNVVFLSVFLWGQIIELTEAFAKVAGRGKAEKFGNTPDHCFICNDDVTEMKCPDKLDKQYYIDIAERRLKDYGLC